MKCEVFEVEHGEVITNLVNGAYLEATSKCERGYKLVGESTRICIYDKSKEIDRFDPELLPVCRGNSLKTYKLIHSINNFASFVLCMVLNVSCFTIRLLQG